MTHGEDELVMEKLRVGVTFFVAVALLTRGRFRAY